MNVHMAPTGFRTEPAAPNRRWWQRFTRTAPAPWVEVETSQWQPAFNLAAGADDDYDWFLGGAR